MTIRFVQQWNGYSPDTIVTLAGAEETRLIGLGFAVTDLDGPGNTPLRVTSTTNLTGGSDLLSGGTVINPHNLKNRFFASLPQGANFRSQKSLAAIPAWGAGVLVYAGYVCHNAGGLYMLLYKLSTGAAFPIAGVTTVDAPTGTGTAVIPGATDLLRWLYMGAYTTDCQSPDLSDNPVCTVATVPAGNTRRYDVEFAADRAAVYFTGSDVEIAAGSGGGVRGIKATTYPNSFSADFMTDAPIVAVSRIQNGGAQQISPTINGWPLWNKTGIGYTWVPAASNNYLSYVYNWSGKPNKTRRIRIPMFNQVFTGVWIDPKYSVWAPSNPNRYRLYIEGDSTTQLGEPGNGQYRPCHRLANILGCDDVWDSSVGNTGFINAGGGSTLISRIPRVLVAAPDILYVRPTNNDVGNDATYNTTTRKAAYTQYFDTLLAALPNLIIICCGGYATGAANLTTTAASAWQVEADMAAAISEYNHPHVKFLATISDTTQRWLLGDGHVGTTVNSTHGNSDLMIGDGTDVLHPNVRYYEYMMQREANGIIGIMNSIL